MTRSKMKPAERYGEKVMIRAQIHAECGRCGLTMTINAPARLRYSTVHCPVCREEALMFSTVMR